MCCRPTAVRPAPMGRRHPPLAPNRRRRDRKWWPWSRPALAWHRWNCPRGPLQDPRLRAVLEGMLEDRLLDEPEHGFTRGPAGRYRRQPGLGGVRPRPGCGPGAGSGANWRSGRQRGLFRSSAPASPGGHPLTGEPIVQRWFCPSADGVMAWLVQGTAACCRLCQRTSPSWPNPPWPRWPEHRLQQSATAASDATPGAGRPVALGPAQFDFASSGRRVGSSACRRPGSGCCAFPMASCARSGCACAGPWPA